MNLPTLPAANYIACADEARWLELRRQRVQASEVAAILGQSSYGSPLSVYTDKTLPAPLVGGATERLTIGRDLEQPIRAMYRRKFGGVVHDLPAWTIAASRGHTWLGCTPDGLCEDASREGVGLLEIKTASEFSRHEWQESAPLAYQIQVQASLAATGLKWGVLAVLIGVQSVDRVFVERNDTFIEAMLPVLADFWSCVELRVAPPVDGSPATARALARLHPADDGTAVKLPAECDARIDRLRRLKSLGKRIGSVVDGIENEIKAAIGDHTYGVTPDGQWVSWKSQTRKETVLPASTFRVLRECKEPKAIEFSESEPALITKG